MVMGGAGVLDLDAADGLDAAYMAIAEHRPLPLGRYLLLRSRTREYWTYQAVVHDLEAHPSSRPGNVRRSLTAILKDAVKRGMQFVVVEPLGMWRGTGLTIEEMAEAFEAAVLEVCVGLEGPLRLVLMLDEFEELEELSHLLRSRLLGKATRSFRTVDGDAALVEIRQRGRKFHCRFVPGSLSGFLVSCIENEI